MLVFIAILISFVSTGSFSAFFFSIFTWLVGYFFCLSIPRKARVDARKVLNTTLFVYIIFALCYYLGIEFNWSDFARDGRDEYLFWIESEQFAHYHSFYDIIQDCVIDQIHIENEAFLFYIGALAYFSEVCLDGNHLFLQFIGTVFWSILTIGMIYKILLLYFNSKIASYYTLLYSLCSIILGYSCVLLRDIHIGFFYAYTLYIVLKGFSLKGLLILIINLLIVLQFRYESGFFLSVFVIYYLYERYKNNFLFLAIGGVLLCFIFIELFMDKFLGIQASMNNYIEYTDAAVASNKDSLALAFYKLPSPLREVMIVIYSQIQPFPSWMPLSGSTNLFSAICNMHFIVRAFFWYFITSTVFFVLVCQRKIKDMPSVFKYLLMIVLVFLVANTSNMADRRIMCVYPIIYLVYVWIRKTLISVSDFAVFRRNITLIYILMIIVYLILKYVL